VRHHALRAVKAEAEAEAEAVVMSEYASKGEAEAKCVGIITTISTACRGYEPQTRFGIRGIIADKVNQGFCCGSVNA